MAQNRRSFTALNSIQEPSLEGKQAAVNTHASLARAKKALLRSNRMRKACKRIAKSLNDELSQFLDYNAQSNTK